MSSKKSGQVLNIRHHSPPPCSYAFNIQKSGSVSLLKLARINIFEIMREKDIIYILFLYLLSLHCLASINRPVVNKKSCDQHLVRKKLLIQLDKEIHESNSVSIFQSGNKMFWFLLPPALAQPPLIVVWCFGCWDWVKTIHTMVVDS